MKGGGEEDECGKTKNVLSKMFTGQNSISINNDNKMKEGKTS